MKCMNENTFKALFPEVKLTCCPYEIQNFGNSIADIQILGQFGAYLLFKGRKYEHTFIVTNANECPNLLSYDATFRMHVLEPKYPKNMLVPGSNVPHFNKMSSSKNESQNNTGKPNNSLLSRPSNVYQILNQLQNKQQANFKSEIPVQSSSVKTTTPFESETQCTEEQMHLMGKEISATPKDVTPTIGRACQVDPQTASTAWGISSLEQCSAAFEWLASCDKNPFD